MCWIRKGLLDNERLKHNQINFIQKKEIIKYEEELSIVEES